MTKKKLENNNEFLSGHTIYLRVIETSDITNGQWHHWYNDYDLTASNQHGIFPINVEQEKEYFLSKDNKSEISLAVCSKKNNQVVGNVSLTNIDLLNKKAEIACTIGVNISLTVGLESIGLIVEHGFKRLNLNKIYGGAHENLTDWVKMLSSLGFKMEGRLKQETLRDNKYSDTIKFALFYKDYIKLTNNRDNKYLLSNSNQLFKEAIKNIKK